MIDWQEVELRELIAVNPRLKLSKNAIARKIGMEHLEPYQKWPVGSELTPFKGGSKFQNDDVLLARITPCLENGKTAAVRGLNQSEVAFGSTEFLVLRSNGPIDQLFLFYLAIEPNFREFAIQTMTGSSGRQRIQTEALLDFKLNLPPLAEQEAIAEVLSSLDDKIDLLKRQNKTLEGMAEALFRQWFIEEAQDDWELCTFGDFFPVKTGKKDANYSTEDGPYPFFTCSQEVSRSPDFSFNGKAILLAGNGNFNVKRYNGKFEAYQRTYVLIPEDPSLHAWLFFHLRFALQKIVMGSRGSVISFLTKGLIQDHEFTKPSELEKHKLDKLDKLLEATDANEAQIKNLTLQRDTLLPKLMSGEVRVQMD